MFDVKNIRNQVKPTRKRIWLRVTTLVLGEVSICSQALLCSSRRGEQKIFAFLVREPKELGFTIKDNTTHLFDVVRRTDYFVGRKLSNKFTRLFIDHRNDRPV